MRIAQHFSADPARTLFWADGDHPHYRELITQNQLLVRQNGLAGTAPEQP
ncbi:hypothetical protein U1839_18370 [Sphingomonas sp. RT2P30]